MKTGNKCIKFIYKRIDRSLFLGLSYISFYKVFINYCVYSLKLCDFLNSASSAAALVFYLPCVCTHSDTERKQRKTRVRNILKF